MAVSLLAHEVSDVCLGKPALKSLPVSATVADALSALRTSDEDYLSVWTCDCPSAAAAAAAANEILRKGEGGKEECRCVGKICMVDVVLFFCREENLRSPASALQAPISDLLVPEASGMVRHLQLDSSLLEAIDLMLDGAQNLVVPIQRWPSNRIVSRKPLLTSPSSLGSTLHDGGHEYCWLTQEDVLRFLLNSIAVFSPIPNFSIQALDIIEPLDGLTARLHAPASSILPAIARSFVEHTAIAVVDDDDNLIGEISPLAIACCEESVIAAVTTLSVGDLMAYIECGSPPDNLVRAARTRLEESNLGALIELMEEDGFSSISSLSSSPSSDEEFGMGKRIGQNRAWNKMVRGSQAVTCCPGSSLVAVMIQALAYRVNYVWVVEEDHTLVGVVTFAGMLKIFREQIPAVLWK